MKFKVLLLSFAVLFTRGRCELPDALDYDYYWEDCNEDGACYYRTRYYRVEQDTQVGDTALTRVEYMYYEILTRSAWEACAPEIAFNATADFFKVCEGFNYWDVESCNLRKRGILDADNQINAEYVLLTFEPLEGADTYIQQCLEWDGQWSDYDYYVDDYYYDRSSSLEEADYNDIDFLELSNPNRKRVVRSADRKTRVQRNSGKYGKVKGVGKNNGRRSPLGKGAGSGKVGKGGKGGRMGKGGEGRRMGKAKRGRMGKGRKGKHGKRSGRRSGKSKQYDNYDYDYYCPTPGPSVDWVTEQRAYCIVMSIDYALRNCVVGILEESGPVLKK